MSFLRERLSKWVALFSLIVLTELPVLVNSYMRSMIDPDIWWHLRVGEWILKSHTLPKVGIFSQYADGHPWVAYSWGFEVFMAGLFRIWGLAAIPMTLAVFRGVIVFTLFAVMFRLANRFWISWLLSAAAIIPITNILVIRPVLLTVLFFTISVGLIFDARRTGSITPLYFFPPLMLVWANVHIQFVYGLGLLGLFVLCELARRLVKQDKSAWVSSRAVNATPFRLIVVVLLSILATLIGPNWGKVYIVIVHYAQNVSQYNVITELVAMSFRQMSDYFVVMLLMAACFVLGRERIDFFVGTLLVVATIASFRANRDLWFLCLVACAILAEGYSQTAELYTLPSISMNLQYAGVLLVAVLTAFGYANHIGLTPDKLITPVDNMYPVRATEFIRSNRLQGPMYNTFDWGGFLIFNLREHPVSIDGRNDLYGSVTFDRMQKTLSGIDWQKDPDLAKANFVILEKTQPLASILRADPTFKLVYSDHVAVIFLRSTT